MIVDSTNDLKPGRSFSLSLVARGAIRFKIPYYYCLDIQRFSHSLLGKFVGKQCVLTEWKNTNCKGLHCAVIFFSSIHIQIHWKLFGSTKIRTRNGWKLQNSTSVLNHPLHNTDLKDCFKDYEGKIQMRVSISTSSQPSISRTFLIRLEVAPPGVFFLQTGNKSRNAVLVWQLHSNLRKWDQKDLD